MVDTTRHKAKHEGVRLVHPDTEYDGTFGSGDFETTAEGGVIYVPAEFVPAAMQAGFVPANDADGHVDDAGTTVINDPHAGSRPLESL